MAERFVGYLRVAFLAGLCWAAGGCVNRARGSGCLQHSRQTAVPPTVYDSPGNDNSNGDTAAREPREPPSYWDPDLPWRSDVPGGPPPLRDLLPATHIVSWTRTKSTGDLRFSLDTEHFGPGDKGLLDLVAKLRTMRPKTVRIEYFSGGYPSSLGPDPSLPFPVGPETLAKVRKAFDEMGCRVVLYDWDATLPP